MASAGFNINNFKSVVAQKNGLQRTNKFLAQFPIPQGMLVQSDNNTKYRQTARFLEYFCEATNFPGVALNVHEVRRYGYGSFEKRPHAPQFTDVNFTFISDGKGEIWTFFQQWLKLTINYDLRNGISGSTGVRGMKPFDVNYKSDYVSDVRVTSFADNGDKAITSILREAYPIFVGDIQVNWSDTNNIMRIPVTFTFADWYNLNTIDAPPTLTP